ncbi:MAG: hypothetical protein MK209_07700, partial [Planctomycetes bacterium]|nr:hypothetical protein [Planctomycetota bacterium]
MLLRSTPFLLLSLLTACTLESPELDLPLAVAPGHEVVLVYAPKESKVPARSVATFQPVDWPRFGPPSGARATGEWELGAMRSAHGARVSPSGPESHLRFAAKVRDSWDSSILRWFTPLEPSDAEFWALLTLEPAETEFAFAEPLSWRADREGGELGGWTEVYADSLHRYFLLPLLNFNAYGSLPSKSIAGRAYRRLWATFDSDEFVLWTDPDTGRLVFAEYTFRKVSEGHTGVLEFLSWAEFDS